MYDCSSLVHRESLIPPEKMLASFSPSLRDQSLYSFLSKMDRIEWSILQTEDRECRPNPNRISTSERFGVCLFSWTAGAMSGLFSGALPGMMTGVPVFNPYTAVTGGLATGAVVSKTVTDQLVSAHQAQACSQISLSRIIRLKEKESDIKLKADEVVNSWSFWKQKEIKQLDRALIYLSNGRESLNS